jgi:protein-disulfide isomerase
MKKIIITVAIVVIFIAAIFLINNFRPTKKAAKDLFYSGPFSYKLMPMEKLGVAAKILDFEINEKDLNSKSPVLTDLNTTKLKLILEAVSKKLEDLTKSNKKSELVVYMTKPSDDFESNSEDLPFSLDFSDERPADVLVKIDDKTYSREQLPLNQVRFSQLETEIFDEKLRSISEIYTRNLLLRVSKENNTTIQGYINKTILKDSVEPTDLEIKDFAFKKGIPLDENSDELKTRLGSLIKEQKTQKQIEDFIKNQHAKELGYIYFHPPKHKIPLFTAKAIIEPSDSKEELPIFMVFSKFKCQTCGELADNINEIRKKYKNKIRIGFVHFSADTNWADQMAAMASFCVNLQSNDAFWEFFNKVSKSDQEISENLIMETAKSTGINLENFSKCFVSQAYKNNVEEQMKYAVDLGVTISPTVIFDTQVLTGNILKKQLDQTINASF